MLGISVSEIHRYPSRPRGFEEPLFPTAASKRAVADHLLEAPWLGRASEKKERGGECAHALEEPVEVEKRNGRTYLVRSWRRRCSWRKRRVVEVLGRWREVRAWWDEGEAADRVVHRVLLSGGAVVEVARERPGGWLLVGVVD